MTMVFFWIVEIALILSVVIAICFYVKALRAHETPTRPGAVIDLCGISAVALPVILVLAKWRLASQSTVSLVVLAVACFSYGTLMGLDSVYLKRAYKTNKEVNAKKKQRRGK